MGANNMICPVCHSQIRDYDDMQICPSCGTPHHRICWDYNNGCGVPNCPGKVGQGKNDYPESFSADSGNHPQSEQIHSPAYAAPNVDGSQTFCHNCGAALPSGHKFCPNCGQNVEPSLGSSGYAGYDHASVPGAKKKSKAPLIIGISAGVLALVALLLFFLLPRKPTSIALSQTSIVMERGDSVTLTYTISPAKASDSLVIWRSDNEKVATVQNGIVTAVSSGTCRVIVQTENGKSSECLVTVNMPSNERKVVGTWRITNILDFITDDSYDCDWLGWKFYIYDDNTGKLYMGSDSQIEFSWWFNNTNDSSFDVYYTDHDEIYFIYAREYDEIWVYVDTSDTDVCITFVK